jgi:hypothetical protein
LAAATKEGAILAILATQIPYLVWLTQEDDLVRHRPLHNHVVMHGKVFAIDHPIWKTWWPPAGHGCRCSIGVITAAAAKAEGYTGPEPTGPWPIAPDTGLPALPDPGFSGAPDPAAVVGDLLAALLKVLGHSPEEP